MSGDDYHFLSLDATRPWPGISQDAETRRVGVAQLSAGSWTHLDSLAAPAVAIVSLLTFPVAAIARAESMVDWFDLARSRVSPGGVVVVEEPGIEAICELEPVLISPREVVLASVLAEGESLDLRLVEISTRPDADADHIALLREVVVPVSMVSLYEAASQSGWELLGQWGDWNGKPIDDRWRIVAFRKLR